ncbi:MAG: hypothetical protein R3C12_20425 [Planctomycetaceae bacterium]
MRSNYSEVLLELEQQKEAFNLQLKAKDDELTKLDFVVPHQGAA